MSHYCYSLHQQGIAARSLSKSSFAQLRSLTEHCSLKPSSSKGPAPRKPNKESSVTIQGLCLHSSCRSSPRAISTGQLHTLLRFHLLPIKQVVFLCPYSMKDERSHLRGCFTLRCLQRLSRPYIATQLCRWHDNWCTRGTSIPVLSY